MGTVPLRDLLAYQDVLDQMLVNGEVNVSLYRVLWARALERAGLTDEEYQQEIDVRWTVSDVN